MNITLIIAREWHRIHCELIHWYGYPEWLTDSFGHWRG